MDTNQRYTRSSYWTEIGTMTEPKLGKGLHGWCSPRESAVEALRPLGPPSLGNTPLQPQIKGEMVSRRSGTVARSRVAPERSSPAGKVQARAVNFHYLATQVAGWKEAAPKSWQNRR
ncbi:hypothetical protein NDU88_005370 [Pleurodeles waltl]|uniref:Uncharacterized protein n=1 Tax=Pleurodeles waltl TaxID=8319 RepID=A0AAV7WBP4_PLEWA|nr:hypothetical protein NDU88_005370 [Pleurodeles waltl]